MSTKWVSDDASNVCMKCGAEFGRLLGASRHHCRACGQLVCQTCKVEAQKVSHVLEPGKEEFLYLAPGSQEEVLKRPDPTSVISTAYSALSSAAHMVKFCHACNDKIGKEHTAFTMASYLLGTLRFFNHERQMRIISICIRAHFAKYESPTGMSILGRDVVQRLRQSFYRPNVRFNLRLYDQSLNLVVSGFFRVFLTNFLGSKFSQEHVAKVDSILISKPDHNFPHHVFISCMLNGAHIPDIRADLLRYLVLDPYRCLHILLSRYVLNYQVTIFAIFQAKAWKSILSHSSTDLFVNYPLLLPDLAKSTTETPDVFHKFVNLCRVLSPSKRYLSSILCNCVDENMFQETCKGLTIDGPETATLFQTLHAKLLSVIYDTEQLENMIQVPWTSPVENTLAKFTSSHPIMDITHKIYSQEPRTIQVDHIVSKKTHHVARVFQSWYLYCEPNFVMSQVMKRIFDLSNLANPMVNIATPLYSKMKYLYNTKNMDLVLTILPGVVSESRIVHVYKNAFSQTVETTLHVLVTILLVQHLASFVCLDVHKGLNLVEVGTTDRNSIIINAPLTYSSVWAIKDHILKGSLHAHTVLGINSVLTKMVHTYLPELYTGLLCLTKVGVPHSRIVEYMDDLRRVVRDNKSRDLVLKYLV